MGLAWCSPLACYRALYNGARNESTPICGIGCGARRPGGPLPNGEGCSVKSDASLRDAEGRQHWRGLAIRRLQDEQYSQERSARNAGGHQTSGGGVERTLLPDAAAVEVRARIGDLDEELN